MRVIYGNKVLAFFLYFFLEIKHFHFAEPYGMKLEPLFHVCIINIQPDSIQGNLKFIVLLENVVNILNGLIVPLWLMQAQWEKGRHRSMPSEIGPFFHGLLQALGENNENFHLAGFTCKDGVSWIFSCCLTFLDCSLIVVEGEEINPSVSCIVPENRRDKLCLVLNIATVNGVHKWNWAIKAKRVSLFELSKIWVEKPDRVFIHNQLSFTFKHCIRYTQIESSLWQPVEFWVSRKSKI